MNIKFIIIVLGEPFSTFSEILGKYLKKKKKFRKKIVLIGCKALFEDQLSKLKIPIKLKEIKNLSQAKSSSISIFNIQLKYKKVFDKISIKSNNYIERCFTKSLKLINSIKDQSVLINGPISKKHFLKKKFLGVTEYLSKRTNSKNEVMLIYNNSISVSPLTTHIPLKYVSKYITKENLANSVLKINYFYHNTLKKKPRFAILGLNPHCETVDKFSEEEKIIIPSINFLKKKNIKISGPFPADTFFIKDNIKKFDVVLGMYHDQVLTPIKTLYNFNAINITIGLPFLRISPDHGPNSKMLGKNLSDPSSVFYAMKFIDRLR